MNYALIENESVVNGNGFRTVLWVSGCSHHCKGCQNPETWDENYGKPFDDDALKCLIEYLAKPFIEGLTITGGDPLYADNFPMVGIIAGYIKALFINKDIWLYTGYTWEEIMKYPDYDFDCEINGERSVLTASPKDILKYVDVLVDGEYVESLRDVTLKWRGSSNQRVIDVQKSLESGNVVLYCD